MGHNPPSVAEFFNEQFANLRVLLTNLKKHNAVRPDAFGRLYDAASAQDALKDIQHLQDRASMGDFRQARDYLTAALARVVTEKSNLEIQLKVPTGQLRGDDFYTKLKDKQRDLGTEARRFAQSELEQSFPAISTTVKEKVAEIKNNLVNQSERGRLEFNFQQQSYEEAQLRGLLQSLPRS